jgi:lipopolysaccharide transport system ATP-binding protein
MSAAIEVRNLSKLYRLSHRATVNPTLREMLVGNVRAAAGLFAERSPVATREFWALRDINFEVGTGEIVGIIGRNGAGKSTLLKILSRIVKPTTGEVNLYGSASSLLEIGTGFHPDLTGRENVYLSGAIIGMKRDEIRRKFDRIVAFAEIESFLDAPVKYYSSGMYLRLAFAISTHLEAEILIIDEVLAVGDAGFQKKCLERMMEISREGRTILFVSHDLTAIRKLCGRVMLLESGLLSEGGDAETVIANYLNKVLPQESECRSV